MKKQEIAAGLIFIILFLAGAAGLTGYLFSSARSEGGYRELRREVEAAPRRPSRVAPEDKEESDASIDFDKLKLRNPDAVGWIRIGDTRVDYPILQTEDNAYYLVHSFERTEDRNGSIFLDCENSPGFTDPLTLIYGHNMKSGAMFGGLRKYRDTDYLDGHAVIEIITPEETLHYRIIAACEVSVEGLRQEIERYLPEDQTGIALITCTSGYQQKRFAVIAAERRS